MRAEGIRHALHAEHGDGAAGELLIDARDEAVGLDDELCRDDLPSVRRSHRQFAVGKITPDTRLWKPLDLILQGVEFTDHLLAVGGTLIYLP